ncbi:PREDICTED: proline-rich protein 26-like [Colobus angolensis palliatus]|uniref:proline-rich protein 26-like n=1 Tax=Colobus angolensis palliatus TaxID=336983 RepID=UPI0005F3B8CD|nr:PREDICTED: proline-rich protein 26-like [Colobus angolensis palliatus]
MESSCWDKVPPRERSPQRQLAQGDTALDAISGSGTTELGAVDHTSPKPLHAPDRGCGPHQPKATACPRPGLWTTPAHGHCMPQTNTRRVQTNIFVYNRCHGYRS